MIHDVIVIGGSYAGMAAALQVARARRRVLVIDAGERRNRFAGHAHGFLGRDGAPPGDIAREAREQLLSYANLDWLEAAAIRAGAQDDGFVVATGDGTEHRAARLVLATGVTDQLPDVPGISGRWGRAVFHCPYCHGHELGDGPIGVLGCHLLSVHQAEVVADWGETIYFANGTGLMTDEAKRLKARGIAIETSPVEGFAGEGIEARLAGGRTIALSGLFVVTKTAMASHIAEQLGCAFDEGITGPCIRVDAMMRTTVPGVFACGDAAMPSGSISLAVGDGAAAGAAAHQSLIFGQGEPCRSKTCSADRVAPDVVPQQSVKTISSSNAFPCGRFCCQQCARTERLYQDTGPNRAIKAPDKAMREYFICAQS